MNRDLQAYSKILGLSCIICIMCIICYWPGLGGPFFLDDFTNLSRLEFLDGSSRGYSMLAFGNDGNVLNRPISYMSFAINKESWPDNPYSFKAINLFLHLVAVFVLWLLLSKSFAPRYKIGLAGTAIFLWALAPIHVSTVLYCVQRMTILATLFLFASLVCYAGFRLNTNKISYLIVSIVFAVLSFLSKETGVLIIPLVCCVEWYLSKEARLASCPKWIRASLILAVLAFTVLMMYLTVRYYSIYDGRSFGLKQRILVEGRVLFEYLYFTFIPDARIMSLYHDDYDVIAEYVNNWWWGFWGAHIAIVICAFLVRHKWPIVTFCVAWFYSSHILESTTLPLELMFEHRNYLASVGPLVLLAWGIDKLAGKLSGLASWSIRVFPIVLSVIFLVYRAAIWGNHYSAASKWAFYHPDSERSQLEFIGVLDSNAMHSMAYDSLLSGAKKFNKLGFYLRAWRLRCHFPEVDKKGFIFIGPDQIESMPHSSEVYSELKLLLEDWGANRCVPPGYERLEMIVFLDSILSMELLEGQPRYRAKILDVSADFYRSMGWYEKAVSTLLDLYEIQPTVDTALKNAEFAIRFGLWEYADEYLGYAIEKNNRRNILVADRFAEIDALRKILESEKRKGVEQ